MSIYRRNEKGNWWIQFTAPDGSRIQQSAGTKIRQEAQELHDNLKAEAWRVKNLGSKPRHTWQEVVVKWTGEQEHRKSAGDDKKYLRWLHPHLHNKHLDEINKDVIKQLTKSKLQTGVSNSTVNHVLAFLRSILNRAKNEWEWIDSIPPIKMLPVKKQRIRWITHAEAAKLFYELPEHLEAMARFTLATGLRESNVTGLIWGQIDMQRKCAWIHADQAKANKDIAIPLNEEALAVLRKQIGKHIANVFVYEGRPVKKAGVRAWRNALKRAGIVDFRWHDLRHTWASWHVQNGTPLQVLMELGGWSSIEMVLRYAHLSSDHLQVYAKNVTDGNVTNLLQAQKKA